MYPRLSDWVCLQWTLHSLHTQWASAFSTMRSSYVLFPNYFGEDLFVVNLHWLAVWLCSQVISFLARSFNLARPSLVLPMTVWLKYHYWNVMCCCSTELYKKSHFEKDCSKRLTLKSPVTLFNRLHLIGHVSVPTGGLSISLSDGLYLRPQSDDYWVLREIRGSTLPQGPVTLYNYGGRRQM